MTWQLEGFDTTPLATAISLIMQERFRQCEKGYDSDHDQEHEGFELVFAATSIAERSVGIEYDKPDILAMANHSWPWEGDMPKHVSPMRDLIIAASLLVAEIERRLVADGN